LRGQLRFHLAAEHAAMWPRVKATLTGDPHSRAVLDALDDERRLLGPLQAMIDDAFTIDADPRRLRQLLARLRTRLASHLAHEEADALPLISQVLSPRELSGIAAAIRGGRSTRRGAITVPWALAGVSPDVMCVGKALTGGYMSLAAALCTPAVAAGISSGSVPVLAHGPTFMGNPLACAVALASLSVLSDPRWYPGGWQASVGRLAAGLEAGLAPARGRPGVADVRVLGAIGVVQLTREVDVAAATAAAVRAGVWLRPFRDLIYTMPPYVTSDEDLALICRGVLAAVEAAT